MSRISLPSVASVAAGSIVDSMVAAGAAIAASKLALPGATPWSPAWTTTGTAPAIGNGSIVGEYTEVGKLVTAFIVLTAGSTTTYGTGTWIFTLPVTSHVAYTTSSPVGTAILVRGTNLYTVMAILGGGGVIMVEDTAIATSVVGQGTPATLQSGDTILVCYTYLAT